MKNWPRVFRRHQKKIFHSFFPCLYDMLLWTNKRMWHAVGFALLLMYLSSPCRSQLGLLRTVVDSSFLLKAIPSLRKNHLPTVFYQGWYFLTKNSLLKRLTHVNKKEYCSQRESQTYSEHFWKVLFSLPPVYFWPILCLNEKISFKVILLTSTKIREIFVSSLEKKKYSC